MKVQLQGQSLRLRIDEAELARLQGGEEITNTTALPGPGHCTQRLRVAAVDQAAFSGSADDWRLALPSAPLEAYIAKLPCKQGLSFTLPLPSGPALEVEFEVDVRDSARVRGKAKR